MSFKHIQIRYQTARSLPAPYAYFYTLSVRPVASGGVQIDLTLTYSDRDGIDEDELLAEGFTRKDDLNWSEKLPNTWQDALTNLANKTRLVTTDEDALEDDDDFWEITIDTSGTGSRQGRPKQVDDWSYLMQELIQAIFERIKRERPFELTYLDYATPGGFELRLTASFADRDVRIITVQDRHERSRTLPWATLQTVMAQVYEHEYDPDAAQLKRPRSGQWLKLGGEEWYNIAEFKTLQKHISGL